MAKKILVIDDDPAVRNAFKLVLEEGGCTVWALDNGLDGIEQARAERPDLIFLDLKMPGIDGVETLRRLKALDATLRVYIVTAFATEFMDQLKAAHKEGLEFELASKPLSTAQIRDIAQIAYVAETREAHHTADHKLVLTLYVVSLTPEAKKLVAQISAMLTTLYEPGRWVFDVVEVLSMPEKALENEVFATPMLVRDVPLPVLRLLGDLSRMPTVMAAITTQNQGNVIQTVIL